MLKTQYVSCFPSILSLTNLDSSAGELFNILNKRTITAGHHPSYAIFRSALLSHCFEEDNCDCGREVQAACPVHRDGEAIIDILRQ
jgi:hypothetical protein